MFSKYKLIEDAVKSKLMTSKVLVKNMSGKSNAFLIEVESSDFANHSVLEQHRMVMGPLKDLLSNNTIHAVSIKTRLPSS